MWAASFETLHTLVDTLVLATDVANHTKLLALFAEKRPWIERILAYHQTRLAQLRRLRRNLRRAHELGLVPNPADSPPPSPPEEEALIPPLSTGVLEPVDRTASPAAGSPSPPALHRSFSAARAASHLRLECPAAHSSDDDDEIPTGTIMGDSDQALAEALGGRISPAEVGQLRRLVLVMAIKAADVSNPARPWHLASLWSDQVMEEFYLQGDLEEELSLPRSKNMDRRHPEQKPACQNPPVVPRTHTLPPAGFIDFLAHPAFQALGQVLPAFGRLAERVMETRQRWASLDPTPKAAPKKPTEGVAGSAMALAKLLPVGRALAASDSGAGPLSAHPAAPGAAPIARPVVPTPAPDPAEKKTQ
ncbi:putative 3'5'-cyclic nucleotide phosphodiesterase [Paratrimastix pyriformis]|uniref:3'5'-cyclic nucleotide phosphodiesterase n=1 Tax=Paratrimastix pyriformis TaxID=342808 RepID=A0ABQ8UQJ4_9EUKA|nr:putative 3'5'-cyclic nucleotide phosphodiesterase [Paratrimastix pyriformis]